MPSSDAGDDPVFVVDDLVLRPGRLDDFMAALHADYRPGAEARGMRLVHTWVTPPTATEGLPQSVILVWQLDGVEGFWRMRSQNSASEVADWWQACETLIESRTRRFAAAPEAVPAFDALGRLHA